MQIWQLNMLFCTHLFCTILRTNLCFSVYNKSTQTVSTAIVIDGGGGGCREVHKVVGFIYPLPCLRFFASRRSTVVPLYICTCSPKHVGQYISVNVKSVWVVVSLSYTLFQFHMKSSSKSTAATRTADNPVDSRDPDTRPPLPARGRVSPDTPPPPLPPGSCFWPPRHTHHLSNYSRPMPTKARPEMKAIGTDRFVAPRHHVSTIRQGCRLE